eukprot:TRINITY_DN1858_c0_g2_i1.p1 TRINITY_DN1858_c0_g2~~TRINITY_DN1858_c0_g2_i1.p1  ORF type:complete len:606 (-),score=106.11 TRINITY_DN1858_c0_g2_i1:180-1967(-)
MSVRQASSILFPCATLFRAEQLKTLRACKDILISSDALILRPFRTIPSSAKTAVPSEQLKTLLSCKDILIRSDALIFAQFRTFSSSAKKAATWEQKRARKLRLLFDNIAGRLGIKHWEEWYRVTPEEFRDLGVRRYLLDHCGSPAKSLIGAYPEIPWDLSKFDRQPQGYWAVAANQRKFLEDLANTLAITEWKQWYDIRKTTVLEHGGKKILDQHGGSHTKAIMSAFPELPWVVWRFAHTSPSIELWSSQKNRRDYLDYVAQQLRISRWEDWYRVTQSDINAIGGASIIRYFGNDHVKMLQNVYPERSWDVAKFEAKEEGFWTDVANQKTFLERSAKKLNVQKMEDWYKVKTMDLAELGGTALMNMFNFSTIKLLQNVYPDFPWVIWRFEKVPSGYWTERAHQREFFDHLAKEFHIRTFDDWYEIKLEDIKKNGGVTILRLHQESLQNALSAIYPEHKWDWTNYKFGKVIGKSQARLFKVVQNVLFPGVADIHSNHSLHIHFAESKREMEMDIWIPSVRIGFEYHGQQHYQELSYMDSGEGRYKLDEEKREACKANGIRFIEVPYWWNGTPSHLYKIIGDQHPELPDQIRQNAVQ